MKENYEPNTKTGFEYHYKQLLNEYDFILTQRDSFYKVIKRLNNEINSLKGILKDIDESGALFKDVENIEQISKNIKQALAGE